MDNKQKPTPALPIAFFFIFLGFLAILGMMIIFSDRIAVLNPTGYIGRQERDLIVTSTILMLIVVIPVFIMTLIILWKYRVGQPKAKYNPDSDHNVLAETLWWGFPFLIVFVLAVIAYNSSYALDPYRVLKSTDNKPMKIQVVALQWKWLFIYPEEQIATVNFFQIPKYSY